MRDFLNGKTREEWELLVRQLIQQGPEGPKVDFKRTISLQTTREKAEFAKDISSIANTDDTHLDDYGLIIVGADRGTLIGGVEEFASGDRADKYQAHLTNTLKNFLAPVPTFTLLLPRSKNLWVGSGSKSGQIASWRPAEARIQDVDAAENWDGKSGDGPTGARLLSGPSLPLAGRRRSRPGARSAERSELALDGFWVDWHRRDVGLAKTTHEFLGRPENPKAGTKS
jgi:hypothetical protein